MDDEPKTLSTEQLEALDVESWVLREDHPFLSAMSVKSGKGDMSTGRRSDVAGNMSRLHGEPGDEENWEGKSDKNFNCFLRSLQISPGNVWRVRPQKGSGEPLDVINVDELAPSLDPDKSTLLHDYADCIYTYDPNKVLSVKTADCAVIICYGQTNRGPLLSLTHVSRQGANDGRIDDLLNFLDVEGVVKSTVRVQVVGGIRPESYEISSSDDPLQTPGRETLFLKVIKGEDDRYHYNVDISGFIRQRFLRAGFTDYQLFIDTSDTGRIDSGYASHSRAAKPNGIDAGGNNAVIAKMNVEATV